MSAPSSSRVIVPGPSARVVAVIGDVAAYPSWTEGVVTARALSSDVQGRVRRAEVQFELAGLRDVCTLDYDWNVDPDVGAVVTFTGVGVHVLDRLRGTYVLEDRAQTGQTHVTLTFEAEPRLPFPASIRRRAEQAFAQAALGGLRRAVEQHRAADEPAADAPGTGNEPRDGAGADPDENANATSGRRTGEQSPTVGSIAQETQLLVAQLLTRWADLTTDPDADRRRTGSDPRPEHGDAAPAPANPLRTTETADPADDPPTATDDGDDAGRAGSPPRHPGEPGAPLGCGCGACAAPHLCRLCPVCRAEAGWQAVAPHTLASLADAADLLSDGLRALARRLEEAAQRSAQQARHGGAQDEGNT